jgi:hypothetical protein
MRTAEAAPNEFHHRQPTNSSADSTRSLNVKQLTARAGEFGYDLNLEFVTEIASPPGRTPTCTGAAEAEPPECGWKYAELRHTPRIHVPRHLTEKTLSWKS